MSDSIITCGMCVFGISLCLWYVVCFILGWLSWPVANTSFGIAIWNRCLFTNILYSYVCSVYFYFFKTYMHDLLLCF